MRSFIIPFSEFKKYLESRGIVFEDREYIATVGWQVAFPESVVEVSIDGPRIGLEEMT